MPGWSETSHFAPHEGHISHIVNGKYTPVNGTSRRARQERVSRTQEGPRARKNVTHIVTILCVQGAPRAPLSLPRHARFTLPTRPYVPIL